MYQDTPNPFGGKVGASELDTDIDIGSGHIVIDLSGYESTTQGTWAVSTQTTSLGYEQLGNSTHADADEIVYKIYAAAGTYKVVVVYWKNTDAGILEFKIGSTSLGTVDTYNGSLTKANRSTTAGGTITTDGVQDFKVLLNGKNASSSNHYVYISKIIIYRTA